MSGSHNGLLNSTRRLNDNADYESLWHDSPKDNKSTTIAEVCARFLELHEPPNDEAFVFNWLYRLTRLHRINPLSAWLYIKIQTGDVSMLTETFEKHANIKHMSRQTAHEQYEEAIEDMKTHFPELQKTLISLHHTFRPSRGRKEVVNNFAGPSHVVCA